MISRRGILTAAIVTTGVSGCSGSTTNVGDDDEFESIPDVDDIPELPDVDDEVRWAHETDDDADVYIDDIVDPVTLPAEIVVILRNKTDGSLRGNKGRV